MRITFPAFAAIALLAFAAQPSMAVGFGRVVNATMLGQPLDITVPVSADPNEQITAECVSAEVMVGDSVLPSPAVHLRLDPSPDSAVRWLRVQSSVRIAEPLVNVTVSAGCTSRVSRQFVVFVDPPLSAYEASVPTAVEPADAAASATALQVASGGATALSSAAASDGSARADGAAAPPRPAASRQQRRQVRQTAAGRTSTETREARASARKSRNVASATGRARASAPRLQLERGTTQAAAPAMAAIASAPTAADVAASAAAIVAAAASAVSEAERASESQRQQIAELQRQLEQSKLDTQVSNAAAAKLQARLQAAEASRYSLPWLVALTVAVAVLLFGIGVLLDRRRLARRPRRPSWSAERSQGRPAPSTLEAVPSATMGSARATAQLEDDDPRESLASTGPLPFSRTSTPTVAARASVPSLSSVAESPFVETSVVSGTRTRAEPVRSALPVTADALIDLEQQAEFFVALGQEDTAVDLLDGFSRGAGGACPMPYLMLLAIHRRRGDRDAHTEVRERYEKRFNRSSPAWDGQPAVATSIADHVDEMRRIESVWGDPPAAMRLVESLLVHGGTPAESFDLHCLGELQFLYLLARDHSEIEPPPAEQVDLLLPLSPLTTAKPVGTAVDLELDFLDPQPPSLSK
jgi:hypothetical protein